MHLKTLSLVLCGLLTAGMVSARHKTAASKYVCQTAGNPYLPLWEHVPDAEPRVFADPDRPGHYRVYIVGSHDTSRDRYCGFDVHEWSAPVEDLTSWRDEGAMFTYRFNGKWDIMYAPDLVEVTLRDGNKKYYLYPQDHSNGRGPTVCVSDRPDGPFKPVNLTDDGSRAVKGSCLGFDPAVYVEPATDPHDADYATGWKAWGYWGFQGSSAARLDPKTMYSVHPGYKTVRNFIPAGKGYGELKNTGVTDYPYVSEGEDITKFGFFEASSMRKVGNKYILVYSGYSGPEYGLSSSNSTLRYAYGDTPMGPWKIGGVLVDSRAPELEIMGEMMAPTNGGHNTHGSLQEINGQWYVFYHRTPRNGGYARQAMVAPVKVVADQMPVSEGGKVTITGYNPYAEDNIWTVKDNEGHEYSGAEVTSEGFHVFGLNPYRFYPAGIACYLSNVNVQQDAWDVWSNMAPLSGVKNGDIIGYKYFGFGGQPNDSLGIKAFSGCKVGDNTTLNLWIKPRQGKSFTISVWIDGPSGQGRWDGKEIGKIIISATDAPAVRGRYTLDVSKYVEGLKGKHAIYLKAESAESGKLFTLYGIGFSSKDRNISYPTVPTVAITADGKPVEVPAVSSAATPENGYTDFGHYDFELNASSAKLPVVKAAASQKDVKIKVKQASKADSTAVVEANWQGRVKTYKIKINCK